MSVSSARGRAKAPLSQSLGRSSRWIRISESSKGSGGNSGQHFDDPFSLSGRSGGHHFHHHGQVFTVDSAHHHQHQHKPGSTRHTHSHILRYGTTRSMPETPNHHDHDHDNNHHGHLNGKVISNGSATTGRRLYSSNPRGGKLSARRVFFNNGSAQGHFVKRGVIPEKKEDAITFFDIEMDKSPFYQYRPGEEISGSVNMDIRHNLEIRYVELVIVGQGTTTVLKSLQTGLPNTSRESYLRKNTCVIGTSDALWSSMLTPGHYVSKFRFRLPKDLPSSLQHDDLSSGFKMDIGYYIKARICDDMPGSVRSNASTGHSGHHHHHHHPRNPKSMVKVLLTKKQPFRVQRPFDINLVPGASTPVTHTEEVYLSCAGNNLVVVTLNLERAVFLAGDDIKLHLAASVPASQRIKVISCRLQQHLTLDNRHADTTTFTLSNVERSDPQATSQGADETSYDVTLPTQTNLVTSFLHGCSMLRLSYTLDIEMRFVPAGGKLSFTIPLGIGPCAEPIYAEKISSRKAVPIFNRPTRFPCFSPTSAKHGGMMPRGGGGSANHAAGSRSSPAQMDVSSRSSQSINVVTKYSNSLWAKCFLCCFTSADVN